MPRSKRRTDRSYFKFAHSVCIFMSGGSVFSDTQREAHFNSLTLLIVWAQKAHSHDMSEAVRIGGIFTAGQNRLYLAKLIHTAWYNISADTAGNVWHCLGGKEWSSSSVWALPNSQRNIRLWGSLPTVMKPILGRRLACTATVNCEIQRSIRIQERGYLHASCAGTRSAKYSDIRRSLWISPGSWEALFLYE